MFVRQVEGRLGGFSSYGEVGKGNCEKKIIVKDNCINRLFPITRPFLSTPDNSVVILDSKTHFHGIIKFCFSSWVYILYIYSQTSIPVLQIGMINNSNNLYNYCSVLNFWDQWKSTFFCFKSEMSISSATLFVKSTFLDFLVEKSLVAHFSRDWFSIWWQAQAKLI